jgi:4-hydroxythreonine-4-phosphate dehydrogenase
MASKTKILITTGDSDGIGWEVTAKALHTLGPKSGVQFFFFRHAHAPRIRNLERLIKGKFKCEVVPHLEAARELPFNPKTLVEIRSEQAPARWVEHAATACLQGSFQALVTAPLSKISIIDAGLKDIGHTEILARITGVQDLFMGFLGRKFCVVLATGHQPLAAALAQLNPERLSKAVMAALQLRSLLPPAKVSLPLAVVGVNPHAGEGGLLGKDEIWFKKIVADLKAKKLAIEGPLAPDAAFLPGNWPRHSVYICPYHDQGLIPFKMIHGFDSGVHLTLGLPFVRTSVDHGTAKDLYGKNQARPGSMKDALTAAIRLSKEWEK